MALFQHPHRIRGIVCTEKGSFHVVRGRVEMADEIGRELGWRRVNPDDDGGAGAGADEGDRQVRRDPQRS